MEDEPTIDLKTQGLKIRDGFKRLLNKLQKDGTHPGFRDASERFRLWASNIGLYHTGHSSLHYRFQDAPRFESFTMELLVQLQEEIETVIECQSTSPDPSPRALPDGLDTRNSGSGGAAEEEADESAEEEDPEPERFEQLVLDNILECLDKLFRLASKIQDPHSRFGNTKAKNFRQIDPDSGIDLMGAYEQFDMEYIEEYVFYQQLEVAGAAISGREQWRDDSPLTRDVIRRLAAANSLRRKQFAYWRRRYQKIRYNPIVEVQNLPQENHPDQAPRPSSQQTSEPMQNITRPQLWAPDLELSATTVTRLDVGIGLAPSDTASTVASSAFSEPRNSSLQIPVLPPRVLEQRNFECPYCFTLCSRSYSKGKRWRNHVIHDLRPYICLVDVCRHREVLFDSYAQWSAHEAAHFEEPVDPDTLSVTCQICLKLDASLHHVADHLERIALFSLPRNTGYEQDSQSHTASSAQPATSESDSISGQSSQPLLIAQILAAEIAEEKEAIKEEIEAKTSPRFLCTASECPLWRFENRGAVSTSQLHKHLVSSHSIVVGGSPACVYICRSEGCTGSVEPDVWVYKGDFFVHCISEHPGDDMTELETQSRRLLSSLNEHELGRLKMSGTRNKGYISTPTRPPDRERQPVPSRRYREQYSSIEHWFDDDGNYRM